MTAQPAPDAVKTALDGFERFVQSVCDTCPDKCQPDCPLKCDANEIAAARAEHAALLARAQAQRVALELADVVCNCADSQRLENNGDTLKATYNAVTAYRAARAKVQP